MAVDVLFKLKVIAESAEFKVSLKSTVFYNSHQSVLCTLRPIKLHSIQEHSLCEGLFSTFRLKNRATNDRNELKNHKYFPRNKIYIQKYVCQPTFVTLCTVVKVFTKQNNDLLRLSIVVIGRSAEMDGSFVSTLNHYRTADTLTNNATGNPRCSARINLPAGARRCRFTSKELFQQKILIWSFEKRACLKKSVSKVI